MGRSSGDKHTSTRVRKKWRRIRAYQRAKSPGCVHKGKNKPVHKWASWNGQYSRYIDDKVCNKRQIRAVMADTSRGTGDGCREGEGF